MRFLLGEDACSIAQEVVIYLFIYFSALSHREPPKNRVDSLLLTYLFDLKCQGLDSVAL